MMMMNNINVVESKKKETDKGEQRFLMCEKAACQKYVYAETVRIKTTQKDANTNEFGMSRPGSLNREVLPTAPSVARLRTT
mmetsp:Transcript_48459/g.117259  ORF Transcript_48459/g.117259 Transcript_48459/m.117259 type:complete len:81 (+) Transcript_48459:40-282(+)